jgi:hypothetical protein
MVSFGEIVARLTGAIRRATPLAGEGTSVQETAAGTIISADPPDLPLPFVPVSVTGPIDADGYYPCSLYQNGTWEAATVTGQKMLLWGMYIDDTATQGFYLARPVVATIATVPTEVWEVVPNIPKVPDVTNSYILMSVAGVVRWILASQCGSASGA